MTEDEMRRAFERGKRMNIRRRTRLMEDTRKEIVRMLNAARGAVLATLAGQPSDYQQWMLPQLQREIERALAEFANAAGAEIGGAANRAWEMGRDLVDDPLEATGVRVTGIAPRLDTRQLVAMRAFLTDRIRDIGTTAANRINTELGLVVIGAQTPGEAVTAVTEILGEPSRARAIGIIRTEIGRVYSTASQQRLEQAARFVPGLKKQWRRSGRLHPRPHHEAADGQVQDVDDPFTLVGPRGVVKLMYPRDPAAPAAETINCGCLSVPYKATWSERAAA
jgi:hypothetical protein